MNDLLNEFLAKLLSEARRKTPTKPVGKPSTKPKTARELAKEAGLKFIRGSRHFWSRTGKKPAEATTEDGKFEWITTGKGKQKKSSRSSSADRGAEPQKPIGSDIPPDILSRRAKKIFGDTPPDSPVSGEVLGKAVKLLQRITERTDGIFSNLLDAIKNGDRKRMQYEVESLGLVVSSTGRLVSTTHGDVFGKGETGRNALKLMEPLLSKFGIKLERKPTKKGKTQDDSPRVSKEEFKPTEITDTKEFPSAETTVLTYEDTDDIRGFSIDGADYRVIRRNKQRLVETNDINEILVGQGMSQTEAEQKAEEYDQIMALHNEQIKYLASKMRGGVTSQGKPIPAEQFRRLPPGQEGRTILKDTLLKKMLENSSLNDDQRQIVSEMLTRLSTADTTEEFDREWETFRDQIENDPTLRPAIPYICEDVEMLRKATGDRTILIPTSDSFKTADVVVLGPPLDGVDVDDMDSVLGNIQLVQVQVDLRSVKSLDGGASVMGEKTELTLFDKEERKRDLLQLTSSDSHATLWRTKTQEQFDAYAREQLKILERHLPDIIAYYKLPEGTTLQEAFEILSGGSPPIYDRDGNYVSAGKPSTKFDEDITELNRLQLRLYSFIGFSADAIYNRGVVLQGFTNTTFYDRGIVETDGRSVMGRSAFQFNKKLSRRPPPNGVLRDDGFASKIVPTPRDRMGTYR